MYMYMYMYMYIHCNVMQYTLKFTSHPVQKSEVIPMKILFKDEKYISETVDILSQLMVDTNITGSPQVGHNINLCRIYIQDIKMFCTVDSCGRPIDVQMH